MLPSGESLCEVTGYPDNSRVSHPSRASSSRALWIYFSSFLRVRWHSVGQVHLPHKSVFQLLSDEVVGEPVHEDGLCSCYRHGEVHPQLIPGSSHQPALCRRLGQQLQTQSADLWREGVQVLIRRQSEVKRKTCENKTVQ